MKIVITRGASSEHSTIGSMSVDGAFQCLTLEDVVRPVKIAGVTAIPAGTYKVIINTSNRFKRRLPLLLDVPGYEGVRIHPGNTDADTEGCILVGTFATHDFVGNSRIAFEALFAKLDAAKEIELTIIQG